MNTIIEIVLGKQKLPFGLKKKTIDNKNLIEKQ